MQGRQIVRKTVTAHRVLCTWKILSLLHWVSLHLLSNLAVTHVKPCGGMAKPHVCRRLGIEIKTCQEKPGHGGGVGTGGNGMNKRQVQTKSGLLGLSTINCRVIKKQGVMLRWSQSGTKLNYQVYIGFLKQIHFPSFTSISSVSQCEGSCDSTALTL